ncbi:hypothetical protein C2845_PM01G18240 [Panicum miliaceum]|uniref:Disease resistance protein RGA3 n=1 Tax=Panicum miliaceum TaxID=4540 RepID=A0A3L6TH32_PANMI|nr:hypothetical protein C2845_PM01G18240 [Panicum miliaceum]
MEGEVGAAWRPSSGGDSVASGRAGAKDDHRVRKGGVEGPGWTVGGWRCGGSRRPGLWTRGQRWERDIPAPSEGRCPGPRGPQEAAEDDEQDRCGPARRGGQVGVWDIRDEVTKLWLAELKQVAYDARDVVEEYEYEVARPKVWALERAKEGGDKSHKRKRHQVNAVPPSSDAAAPLIPSDLTACARNIRERFDEIIKDFGDLRLFDTDGERRLDPDIHTVRHTCSFVFEPSIIRREHDKQNVIEMLLSGGTANTSYVSVLPIVGMGGVGKTTLAQLVYNDPQVHQAFEQHAWVCVSDHFDIENITSDILTSLVDEWSDITGFVNLQSALINKIDKKSILLVLDDVWNEHLDWCPCSLQVFVRL